MPGYSAEKVARCRNIRQEPGKGAGSSGVHQGGSQECRDIVEKMARCRNIRQTSAKRFALSGTGQPINHPTQNYDSSNKLILSQSDIIPTCAVTLFPEMLRFALCFLLPVRH